MLINSPLLKVDQVACYCELSLSQQLQRFKAMKNVPATESEWGMRRSGAAATALKLTGDGISENGFI
jgi:hypothetical protein